MADLSKIAASGAVEITDGVSLAADLAAGNPSGSETGLVVRNIPSGTQSVAYGSGTFPVSGTITAVPAGTQAVSGTWLAGQIASGSTVLAVQGVTGGVNMPVSGTITALPSGTQAVSGTITNVPSGTQAVSGTITNVPSGTQAVSGTVTAVQAVAGDLNVAAVGTLTAGQVAAGATILAVQGVTGGVELPVAGTVTNVPSGTQSIAGTVTNVPSGTQSVAYGSGTFPVSGTITNVPSGTQPVSGTVTTVPTGTQTTAPTGTQSVSLTTDVVSSFLHNQVSVGTIVAQLSGSSLPAIKSVIVKSLASNTGLIYVGSSSGVTTITGFELAIGESIAMPVDDANKVWMISDTPAQAVCYIVF